MEENTEDKGLPVEDGLGKESAPMRMVRKLVRLLYRVFSILFIVLFCLALLFQVPMVQRWCADRTAAYLSGVLETEVRIGAFHLGWMGKLALGDLYIEGLSQDTLLQCGTLSVRFNPNPIRYFAKGLTVWDLSIQDAVFQLRNVPGTQKTNAAVYLERLFPPKPKQAPKQPLILDLRKLSLENLSFSKIDDERGSSLEVALRKGFFRIDTLDLAGKRLRIRQVALRGPDLRIGVFPSAPGYVPPAETEAVVRDTLRWDIEVSGLSLREGAFRLDNYFREPNERSQPGAINYRHLHLREVGLWATGFKYAGETYSGVLDRLAFKEKNGFVLNGLSVKDARVDSESIQLNGLHLLTPQSHLGDTLSLRYRTFSDFSDFPGRVRMDLRFAGSRIAVGDLLQFAPGLHNVSLFKANKDEVLAIDGRVSGRVNSLNGQNLRLGLQDGSRFEGAFSSRNLAVKHEEALNLRLARFSTTMRRLRQLAPGMNLPKNFDRLGRLDFNGSFTGFFEDFVAFGNLKTDLGKARMDMQMVLRNGKERASYAGKLQLMDFDLGTFSGNPNFGKVSLDTRVINGKGLEGETAEADLEATISSFQFKGYTYENARLAGKLRANRFNGGFVLLDDNIDFNFLGQVDFSREAPVYDFQARINKLDLQALNLSKSRNLVLSGDIRLNFKNKKMTDLEGSGLLRNFEVTLDGQPYRVDSAAIATYLDPLGNKIFSIQSDVLKAKFSGLFEVGDIPVMVLQHLAKYHPGFAKRLKINPKDTLAQASRFDFFVEVVNSKGFENLIHPGLGSLSGTKLEGHFDNRQGVLNADLQSPWLQYDRFYLEDIAFQINTRNGKGSLDFGVNRMVLNEKQEFEPLAILMQVHGDSLDYGLNYARKKKENAQLGLDNLNIDGRLFVQDSNTLVNHIVYSQIELLGDTWVINKENALIFKKDQFIAREFILTRGNKAIVLESKGKKGLELSFLNLEIGDINNVIKFKPIAFSGRVNAVVSAGDIFNLKDIQVAAVSDSLFMNGKDWGVLRVNARMKDQALPIHLYVSLTRDTTQMIAEGFYNLRDSGDEPIKKAGYFDLNLNVHSFPLSIAEYFIGTTVSNTSGIFDADMHFSGYFPEPETSGEIYLFNGATTVNYLKTRYTLDRAVAKVNNVLFDISGAVLKDRLGNTAVIQGGVVHRYLHKFGFGARLLTDKFLALETQKGDNSTFYGTAFGKGEVTFSGLFSAPNIYVNAQVGEGTEMVIPVSSARSAGSLSFISFVDKNKPKAQVPASVAGPPSGVSFDMDLVVVEPAMIQIIFNEQTGDIIKGTGRGALRMSVPRNQSFQMFGDIVIEQGEYLFTLYNVINKDFAIKRGGTLSWSGDPFKAIINIDAEYKDLKAPVSNFIQEYLTNAPDKTRTLASRNTDVDLTLKLKGDLLKPTVSFDLAFPTLQSELQSYAENKLRLLKQDQNEMNKQVFGLIVAGQFLPADFSFQGSQILYNTVSELLSNQLSLLITELFSDLMGGGKVSSVDFDIAYSQYQSALSQDGNLNRGNELQVSLRQNYFNDRLSILVGGNIGLGNNWRTATGATGAFIGNDVAIEYQLVEDRSLKLRIYQKLQPDIGGRILQIGSGLSYRKEFNTFGEFLRNLRLDLQKRPPTPLVKPPDANDSLR
jgi:hypothetical protein